jgi:hypothetical protein
MLTTADIDEMSDEQINQLLTAIDKRMKGSST